MTSTADPAARTAERPLQAQLARRVLSNLDIATSTMANIAPAISFFFGFGLIASTAGVAAPPRTSSTTT